MTECIKTHLGCSLLRLNQFTHKVMTLAVILHTFYCNPLFVICLYVYITFLQNVCWRNVLQNIEETVYFCAISGVSYNWFLCARHRAFFWKLWVTIGGLGAAVNYLWINASFGTCFQNSRHH